MSRLDELVKRSINRIQGFEPVNGEGYFLAFSGGKDSIVTKRLMDMAGVKYDAHFSLTSVDPPELIKFIKEHHADVAFERQYYKKDLQPNGKPLPKTMWNLIPKKGLPNRIQRFCCAELKESAGDGRLTVTGVRWAESTNRKNNQGLVTVINKNSSVADHPDFESTKRGGYVLVNDNEDSRMMVEHCYMREKTIVNPIIDWEDKDVWEFIRAEKIPYCELYDEGYHRIGCIGCPMASTEARYKNFARWPKYKIMYLHAMDKYLKRRAEEGRPFNRIDTAEELFHWWIEDGVLPGQMSIEDFM